MSNKEPNKRRFSPIPKHLSPEELEEWRKQQNWDQKEIKRRKKEGFYPSQSKSSKRKVKLKKNKRKKDDSKTELYYF